MKRLALVAWSGRYGGAESTTVALAIALRRIGVDAGVVFVTGAGPFAARLDSADVPWTNVGLSRGALVLVHPQRFARPVLAFGPDGAIVAATGYIATALRLGGYRARIVAVEHGSLLQVPHMSRLRRIVRIADRALGARFTDIEVAVSDYLRSTIEKYPHAPRIARIFNGIDPVDAIPDPPMPPLRVGAAGRLIPGKGFDILIRAAAIAAASIEIEVTIAGDGAERLALESLAKRVGAPVHFTGWRSDLTDVWRDCHVAVVPSTSWIESFGMVAIEAMAMGRPVVASRNGALAEVVRNGQTGALLPPGDADAIAAALVTYASHPSLRRSHGDAARADVRARFSLTEAARAYVSLFEDG